MVRSSKIIGSQGPLRYLVSVPLAPRASSMLPRPVLCFLHGYDEAAPLPLERGVTRHGPLRRGSAPVARERFIFVAPQLPRAGDLWHHYAHEVMCLVRQAREEHGGDASRTYLTGFSFGGNGVFDLAAAYPGEWAALWAVDPTRAPRERITLPLWLSVGQAARWQRDRMVRRLGLSDATVLSLEQLAGDRYYLDGGHNHLGSAIAAYRDERIYRWLLAKSRA